MGLPEHVSIKSSRSYRPLPAVLRAEGEWEGGKILREISSALGVFLFGTLRDAMHWLLLSPAQRRDAFGEGAADHRRQALPGCGPPPELRDHLQTLIRLCDEDVAQNEVGIACNAVAAWAGTRGAIHTQLAYTQAAALAQPEFAPHALATAKLARDLSQHRRAETWFRRTIKLARVLKDWSTYVYAYLGLGVMYSRIGNGPAAKAIFERALKSARRWRLRELAGRAHHDLFHVWADLGDLRRAYDHAKCARVHYGKARDSLYRLAADLGVLSVKVGAPERAIPIFQSLLPRMPDPTATAMLLAHLARAAAAYSV